MAFGRSWLYHKTCPAGRIFDQEEDFLNHLKDGWVEAPWLVDEPDPEPTPPLASPEPVREVKAKKPRAKRKVGAKRPGRPSTNVKGGK